MYKSGQRKEEPTEKDEKDSELRRGPEKREIMENKKKYQRKLFSAAKVLSLLFLDFRNADTVPPHNTEGRMSTGDLFTSAVIFRFH